MPQNETEIVELWQAFKKGDKYAFGNLATTFYKPLYNYGSKLCLNSTLVEDCIQDLFLELWNRRQFLGDTEHVKFYLLKSLRRKIFNQLKSENKLLFASTDEYENAFEFGGEFSIESKIIEGEASEFHLKKLKIVLEKLSKREKEVIYLKFYQNLDYQEIANIMSINYQSARNLVYAAIKELKGVWYQE